jgi:hypothetical protein
MCKEFNKGNVSKKKKKDPLFPTTNKQTKTHPGDPGNKKVP